jgi:antitoxin component of MazEF toxin-antitoxin module
MKVVITRNDTYNIVKETEVNSMAVKLRKQGNSAVLSVPAEYNFEVGTEFNPTLNDDGSLLFTPVEKHVNYFERQEWQDFDLAKETAELGFDGDDIKPVGREVIEW